MHFEAVLQRFDAALQHVRPEFYASLQPPATPAELATLEEDLGQALPAEITALLKWKNGQEEREPELWRGYSLLGTADIGEFGAMMNEMLAEGEWDNENWWHVQYVPFAMNWGGDYLLIDVGGHTGKPGEVIDWMNSAPMRIATAPNLSEFIEAIVVGLESGLGDTIAHGPAYEELLKHRWPGYPQIRTI